MMLFGLCNDQANLRYLRKNVVKALLWKTCLVYLDGIIVVGNPLMPISVVLAKYSRGAVKRN